MLHFRYRFLSLLLNIIYLPLFLLHSALTLTRLAVASALTIAAFFPVLAVHGISQIIRAYKIHKIEALDVIEVESGLQEGTRKPLKQWLTEHNRTIEDVLKRRTTNSEQKILFAMNGIPTVEGIGDFYLPLFKSNQVDEQEGLEDLADLSKSFNKEFSKKINT